MSSSEIISGRILRPRQFVPVPDEWINRSMIREDWAGRVRWFGAYQHPEIENLIERHAALMSTRALRTGDREASRRVEALLLHATEFFAWWFMQMDPDRMLPDATERPEPEAVTGLMPSWEAFISLIGAIHRSRLWIEAIERRHGIEHPTASSIWARAYGVDASEIEARRG